MKTAFDLILSRRSTATAPATSFGLLILRLGTGLTMAFGHGWGKLTTFSEGAAQFPDPLGVGSSVSLALAVFAEFFCSLAITAGLVTRAAVVPVMITMLVAFFLIHGADPFAKQEKSLLYLIPLMTLFLTGPGRYSLDRLFARK